MYGNVDINTADSIPLVLQRTTVVYMLRVDGWNTVPMDGWIYISEGIYLNGIGVVKCYKRLMEAGTYKIDNNSAMYLFDKGSQVI